MLSLLIPMSADAVQSAAGGSMYMLIITILMLVAMYFLMLRPQRKKDKEDAEMRKNVRVGDEVETISGIVGIITKIEDNTNTVVIETSSDRCKMRMKKWAISANVTANEEAKRSAEAAKAEKTEKKGKKDKEEDLPIEKD